jgi:ribosomal protein S18 acetylase RimI-like enzyme
VKLTKSNEIMNYAIRLAELADARELTEVCKASFYETFVGTCTQEDMENYLEKTYPLSRIENEIVSQDCLMYVLISDLKIIGYAKIGWNLIAEMKDRKAIEIERLYFLKDHIGKGLGTLLMNQSLKIAAEKKAEVIYLGVWEHNYRAQKFYTKFGFEVFGSHPFPIESTPQTDLWMKKELL